MGFGLAGLRTAQGAGEGIEKLVAQRLLQARMEQQAQNDQVENQLRQQQIALGGSQLESLNEERGFNRQVRQAALERQQAQDAQLQAIMNDPNARPELKEYARLMAAGVGGSTPSGLFAQASAGSNTPEENFIAQAIAELGRKPTAAELLKYRQDWGRSDNAPWRGFPPIVIQGLGSSGGPAIVDRGTGQSRDVIAPGGTNIAGPPDSAAMRTARAGVETLMPFVSKLGERATAINSKGTIAKGGLTGRIVGRIESGKGAVGMNDEAALYDEAHRAFAGQLARLGGEVGVLTDQDIQRALDMAPSIGMSPKLTADKMKDLNDFLASKWAAYQRKQGAPIGGTSGEGTPKKQNRYDINGNPVP